jgi:hypothetical protein
MAQGNAQQYCNTADAATRVLVLPRAITYYHTVHSVTVCYARDLQ